MLRIRFYSSRTRRFTKLSHSPNPLPHWYTNAAHYFAHFVAHGKGYHWLSAADIMRSLLTHRDVIKALALYCEMEKLSAPLFGQSANGAR